MDDPAFRKQLFQALRDDPLEPDDPRYVPFYKGQPNDPVRRLAEQIEFSEIQSFQMFSGFRGSGKTTELNRLAKQLGESGFVVLHGSALEYVNSAAPLDIVTMLFALAGSFSDELQKAGFGEQIKEGYWTRITNFLTRTNVNLDELKLKPGVPFGEAEFKFDLRQTPTFRQKLTEKLTANLSELKQEVWRFFEDGIKAIRKGRGKNTRVVFILDQLEQIRGSGLEEEAVIESVNTLFANHVELLKIPSIHLVYTVPPWLRNVLPGLPIESLPALALWKNDDGRTVYEDNRQLLRNVIIQRFKKKNFERFFGCKDAVGECSLADKLCESSGGSLRDLLRLVRESVLAATSIPVDDTAVQRAIMKVRAQFLPIPLRDAEWLVKIARSRSDALEDRTPKLVARFSLFLDVHLVFQLKNGAEWYDVHPLVRHEVEEIVRRAEKAKQ